MLSLLLSLPAAISFELLSLSPSFLIPPARLLPNLPNPSSAGKLSQSRLLSSRAHSATCVSAYSTTQCVTPKDGGIRGLSQLTLSLSDLKDSSKDKDCNSSNSSSSSRGNNSKTNNSSNNSSSSLQHYLTPKATTAALTTAATATTATTKRLQQQQQLLQLQQLLHLQNGNNNLYYSNNN